MNKNYKSAPFTYFYMQKIKKEHLYIIVQNRKQKTALVISHARCKNKVIINNRKNITFKNDDFTVKI